MFVRLPAPEEQSHGHRSAFRALWLGEARLTIAVYVLQFPPIALGMSSLLICVLSPRRSFGRRRVPGAAFVAIIAYSVYFTHKLIIHFAIGLCGALRVSLNSFPDLVLVEAAIYAGGTIFFLVVERPFLQLRDRIDRRNQTNAGG